MTAISASGREVLTGRCGTTNEAFDMMYTGSMLAVNDTVGVSNLQRFVDCRLGNFVILKIHWHKNTTVSREVIEKAINFCCEHHIYFMLSEFLDRYTREPWKLLEHLTKEDWSDFQKLGGEFFCGNLTICEKGGAVYWPLGYKHGSMLMEKADTMDEAIGKYVDSLRLAVEAEHKWNRENLVCIDSSLLHKYHFASGVDMIALELFPGNCEMMFPAVRGAARAAGKTAFGTDIAMVWYGGVEKDELWFKRWKMSLYYSYLSGVTWAVSETGEFGINGPFGRYHDFDSDVCVRFRNILHDFYEYTRRNPRPEGLPQVRIAIVHGQYDGCGGLWNKEVWGQYQDEKFLHSDAEDSYDLLSVLNKKSDWFDAGRMGERDLSGNPPLGQYDILPAEADLEVMQKYPVLVFLGWNTMDESLYEKLKQYVSSGGRLFMCSGHLNCSVDRKEPIRLYNDGDVADLFGVRLKRSNRKLRHAGLKFIADSGMIEYAYPNWTENADPKYMDTFIPENQVELCGAKTLAVTAQVFSAYQKENLAGTPQETPAFTEYRLGSGYASLVTLDGYPGSVGIKEFYREILKCVCVAEQDKHLQICAPDKVRYSVYDDGAKYSLFFLNTDFDLPAAVKVFYRGNCRELIIPEASPETLNISKMED